jgi:hypothetical protein
MSTRLHKVRGHIPQTYLFEKKIYVLYIIYLEPKNPKNYSFALHTIGQTECQSIFSSVNIQRKDQREEKE